MPRHPGGGGNHVRGHNWLIGSSAGVLALAALVAGSAFGHVSGTKTDPKLVAWTSAAAVLVFGVLATARLSAALSRYVATRSIPSAGGAIRILAAAIGYLFVLFSVLGVLTVSVEHLLIGAGLAGVVLGIAAQQSLGNVFAGLVLLAARPFGIGDHIRVRSGALGGIFDARVQEVTLTYVTLHTDDGELMVPNSAMLAAGVMRLLPGAAPLPAPLAAAAPAAPATAAAPASASGPRVVEAAPSGETRLSRSRIRSWRGRS